MRKILIIALLILFSFKGYSEHTSYKTLGEYLGYRIWHDLKETGGNSFSMTDFMEGVKKAEKGESVFIQEEEARILFATICEEKRERDWLKRRQQAEEHLQNLKTAGTFHENGKLVIEILKTGEGPEIGDKGLFHLRGNYLNGGFCIDTYEQNNPLCQSLDEAILGFRKGVKNMRAGEKRRLFIHPDLAYGIYDLSNPNELLILEVELLKVLK